MLRFFCYTPGYTGALFLLLISLCHASETFVLLEGTTGNIVSATGSHIHERLPACSTFKIALCLMGFDAGILKDGKTPTMPYREGYADSFEVWKAPQTPQTWITNSCVWYSQQLTNQMGMDKVQHYLDAFDYGNRDMSCGLTKAWLSSSLKISPLEQTHFVRKMLKRSLPVASDAIEKTKSLLFKGELSNGWQYYGKTDLGSLEDQTEVSWVVGWVENEDVFFPFAYTIKGTQIPLSGREDRVKQLLINAESVVNESTLNALDGIQASVL